MFTPFCFTSKIDPQIRLQEIRPQQPPTDRLLQGRLEIKVNDVWGTVCDDFWNDTSSHVACHQLGFPAAVLFRTAGESNAGSGRIVLDDVRCDGNERYLTLCDHKDETDCSHLEDITLVCSADPVAGISVPKWQTEPITCNDWRAVCAGNCYSGCGSPSLIEAVGTGRNNFKVTIIALNLNHHRQFQLDGFNLNLMTIYAQNVIIDNGLTLTYDLTVVTRRLDLHSDHLLDRTPETDCYGFQSIVVNSNKYYYFVKNYNGHTLTVFAELLRVDAEECINLQTVDNIEFPGFTSRLISMSVACVDILATDLTDTQVCLDSVIVDTAQFVYRQSAFSAHATMAHDVETKLNRQKSSSKFVPTLSSNTYKDILNTYDVDLQEINDDIERLEENEENLNNKIEFLELMEQKAKDVQVARRVAYNTGVFELEVSKLTMDGIRKKVGELQKDLKKVQKKFENDVKKYKRKQAAKSIFGFFKAIATIVVGVVTGNPGLIVAGVASTLNQVIDLVILIETINGLEQTIDDVIDHLNGRYDMTAEQLEYSKENIVKVAELRSKITEWETLENVAEGLLGVGTVTELASAGEYRRIVTDVATYGKALTEEAVRNAELLLEKLEEKTWLDVSAKEVERLGNILKDKATLQQNFLLVQSEIEYQSYLLKYNLINIMHTYCQSVFYYQFHDCSTSIKPSLTDSLLLLRHKISRANREHITNMEDFQSGKPQTFNIPITLVDHPDCRRGSRHTTLKNCPVWYFRQNKEVTVNFNYMNSNLSFTNYDRVRVKSVRVYLDGAVGKRVNIKVYTSGVFMDRFQGNYYDFVGLQFRQAFEYKNKDKTITIKGVLDDDQQTYFQMTTPFTTWTISATSSRNANLDVSRVTSIRIEMTGSAIGA
ncbi:uncharacterized protein LOC117122158 [Anneissia japonica]|uniref:uncharacterized protein LOC117122158 n=1 Tax=Anneissia japonica TaxID=1529436 RepID=UPI00142563B0|nr:uncharacterized protein LOC117122158 [Anneissia japonica]